jgi:hypothetical protein
VSHSSKRSGDDSDALDFLLNFMFSACFFWEVTILFEYFNTCLSYTTVYFGLNLLNHEGKVTHTQITDTCIQ